MMIITERELITLDDIILKTQKRCKTISQIDSSIVKKLGLDSALEHKIYQCYARFKRLLYEISYQEQSEIIVKSLLVIRFEYVENIDINKLNNDLFNAKIKNVFYDIIYEDDLTRDNPLNFGGLIISRDKNIQEFLKTCNTSEERIIAISEYFEYDYSDKY